MKKAIFIILCLTTVMLSASAFAFANSDDTKEFYKSSVTQAVYG